MYTLLEPPEEKVETGSIVIITGEYIPIDNENHDMLDEPIFLSHGETAPDMENKHPFWKLKQMFDFTS